MCSIQRLLSALLSNHQQAAVVGSTDAYIIEISINAKTVEVVVYANIRE